MMLIGLNTDDITFKISLNEYTKILSTLSYDISNEYQK